MVTSLGRDTRDILNLIRECEQRGASATVLDPHVSAHGDVGHRSHPARRGGADERRFIEERQRKGINLANSEGRYTGRRRRTDRAAVIARRAAGDTVATIAAAMACVRM